MKPFRSIAIVVCVLSAMTMLACGPEGADPASEGAANTNVEAPADSSAADDEGADDGAPEGDAASEDGAAEAEDAGSMVAPEEGSDAVGAISSGTAEAPPQAELPTRPTQAGVSRMVSIEEARGMVDFQLLEPTFTPESTELDVTMVVMPRGDAPEPGLPGVRWIYTIASANSFIVYQTRADGRPLPQAEESSAVTVGDSEGQLLQDGSMNTIVWEQGGTRVEITSREVAPELLTQIAESMQPLE